MHGLLKLSLATVAFAAAFAAAVALGLTIALPRVVFVTDSAVSRADDLVYYHGQKLTGVLRETYPNGVASQETEYRDGIKNGSFRTYGITGRLLTCGTYLAGQHDGSERGWYAEGPTRYRRHYDRGWLDGRQQSWHLNGEVFRDELYVKGLAVEKKILYSQGEVFSNYVKKNGRTYGLDGGSLCMERKPEGAK